MDLAFCCVPLGSGDVVTAPRGPLASSYLGAVALVICALVPFLLLTGAIFPLLPLLSKDLGLSKSELTLATGLADGAYAFGTVLAVQFAAHLRARRMLLLYVTAFLVAAVLAAWAPTGMVFVVALVVEGLCTSLMLIATAGHRVAGGTDAGHGLRHEPVRLRCGRGRAPRSAACRRPRTSGGRCSGAWP